MRRLPSCCLLLLLATCGVEEGVSLQITAVAKINASCSIDAPTTLTLSRGFYDPRGFINGGVPTGYQLLLNIRNNLAQAKADPVAGFTTDNRHPDANDAQIVGFDVCWFSADESDATAYGSWDNGVPERLKCGSLPASQKRVVPATGEAKSGGGLVGLAVEVLDLAALQSLYGGAFNPLYDPSNPDGSLDPIGPYGPALKQYSYAPGDPSNAARDAAWGNFPLAPQSTVVLQARAIAKLQDGSIQRSDWLVYPIDICVGCMSDACGPLTIGAPCGGSGPSALTGSVVDIGTSCLPSQEGTIMCLAGWSSCP